MYPSLWNEGTHTQQSWDPLGGMRPVMEGEFEGDEYNIGI